VPGTSPHAAEAAYHVARLVAKTTGRTDGFESVATQFAGTPWAEEALLALANHYQKDARDEEALPYYRRMLEGYPTGRYAERAVWRVAWADFRGRRFEQVAQALEPAARTSASTTTTAGFLYWAGRARRELGQNDRARQLLEETVQRFKHNYYGLRAQDALKQLPPLAEPAAAVLKAGAGDAGDDLPEPHATRLRQLLLIDRLDEARDELQKLPPTRTTNATLAWIEHRRGRMRQALIAMKRAYPEWVGAAGAGLPEDVWRIMYPIDYSGLLLQKSAEAGLDPALVAALICQESTFNAGALSSAGARGLMQVIPKTGRVLARALRVRYENQSLFDPNVSLTFGTRYLQEMLERYGGRVERALAAYNAGPHRVDAWTAERPDIGAEEFVESIPFTETRNYVMTILANREQYRRIYALPAAPAVPAPGTPAAAATPLAAGGGT
jgi:soluble lytic murein transglycosylase